MKLKHQGLVIAGHRGFGCTDHDFYQDKRNIANLPPENTLQSIKIAFEAGAVYVEIDAVMSADGVLFSIHNVVPGDHFFGEPRPTTKLNSLPFEEINACKTGRTLKGDVATLPEIFALIDKISPKTLPWDINIEIKGVQGSGQPYEVNDYLEKLAAAIKESKIPAERILFSSFSLANITRMAHLLPEAKYGMLFCEDGPEGQKNSRPIYADHKDSFAHRYQPFSLEIIDHVKKFWQENVGDTATLGFLHPEIGSITQETVNKAAADGFGINCWALFEELTEQRQQQYRTLTEWCKQANVFVSAITDYVTEMIALKL